MASYILLFRRDAVPTVALRPAVMLADAEPDAAAQWAVDELTRVGGPDDRYGELYRDGHHDHTVHLPVAVTQ